MGNETMKISEVVARNAAAEKAMADAIQILEEALSDAAELHEMERAEVYAVKFRDVLNLLRGAQMNTWRQTSRHFVSLPDAYAQKCVLQDLVCGISVKPDIDGKFL